MKRRIATLAVVLALASCHRDEPMAGGKPLSHWKKEATKVSFFTFLNSDKDERRREAFRRLSEIGEPAVPALVDLLTTKRIPISGDAFNALANLGPRAASAVPAMIELLDSERDDLRREAAWILGTIGSAAEPAVPHLTPLLTHSDERLRRVAAQALGQIGGAGHVALRQANLTGDARTRAASMRGVAMPEMDPAERREFIMRGMQDASPEVRLHAVEVMMTSKREEAEALVAYLVQALNDPDAKVKEAAHTVFNVYLQHQVASPAILAAVLKGGDVEARADAAWRLGFARATPPFEPNDPAVVAALRDALADPEIKIRIYAARALAQEGGAARNRGLAALRRDVPHAYPILAVRGARALWAAERDIAFVRPVYERGLQDPERWNRVETISAILDMGDAADSFRPELERLRSDPAAEVRDRAEKALHWLQGRSARNVRQLERPPIPPR